MGETLLQKAMKVKRRSLMRERIGDQEIELALAWLQDKITISQAAKVVSPSGKNSGNVSYKLAICLKEAYIKNLISIK